MPIVRLRLASSFTRPAARTQRWHAAEVFAPPVLGTRAHLSYCLRSRGGHRRCDHEAISWHSRAIGAAVLVAPTLCAVAGGRRRAGALADRSSTPMSAASTGSSGRAYESRTRHSPGFPKTARPARSGSSTAPTPSTTPRIAAKRSSERTSSSRARRARSRRYRLCGGRGEARAVAEGSRRLLSAGELQGRPDGQGRALHPRLVAAWDAFAKRRQGAGNGVEAINDKGAAERLAEIESKEGRKARYHALALMIHAKRLLRTEKAEEARHISDHAGAGRIRSHREGARSASRRSKPKPVRPSSARPSRTSPRQSN